MFTKTYPQVGATALLCKPVSSISNYVKAIIFIAFLSACSLKARSKVHYGDIQTIQMLHAVKERFKTRCPALTMISTEVYNLSKDVISVIGQEVLSLIKSVVGSIVLVFGAIGAFTAYCLRRICDFEFDNTYKKIRNFFRRKRNEAPPEQENKTLHEETIENRVEEEFENGQLSKRIQEHGIQRKTLKK